VGALFDCGIENGSPGAAELCAETGGLNLEFLNGIDGWKNDKVCTIQEVHSVRIVVNTIEQVIVLRGPKSIGSKSSISSIAARIGLRRVHAGSKLRQECKVASVQREIIHALRVHDLTD